MKLTEAYAKRLAISESVYSKKHNGEKMDSHKKIAVAKCLQNVNSFLNEAFDASVGTQRSDMGLFKKFCLNLTTVALPNLIAHDLVMVSPMSSMSGYVTYIEYQYSTTKGDAVAGETFNSPFALGDAKADFTSERVVETVAEGATSVDLSWTPVVKGAFEVKEGDTIVKYDVKITPKEGAATYANAVEGEDGKLTVTAAAGSRVAYVYNNVIVPQNNIPSIKAEMKSIPLLAKARRIAVYYSQIAAFQAKTDYGFDLGDQLAEKAVGQLSYEIDTEIVNFLDKIAAEGEALPAWDRTVPAGISKAEHYEGFAEAIEIGRQVIYDRTKRFAPNYMIIASDILPILTFMRGFSAAPAGQINGPYFAGTLNGLKVFVSPAIAAGRFLLGVNGDDMMSSVAVYAPYMAIVPTQLLQYADGGTSQGWSTMYDLVKLNGNLIVAGSVSGSAFATVGSVKTNPFYNQVVTEA
jgi:hypothetical protein